MMRWLKATGAVAALVMSATAAQAQDQWVTIGSKSVATSGRTNDTIDLSNAKGNFKAFRLITKDGAIVIDNVELLYAGGATHNERRTINMNPNDRTRAIDQRDQARFVEKLTLTYKSGNGNSVVEVQGLQSNEGARASRSASAASPAPSPSSSGPAPSPKAPVAAPIPAAPTAPVATTAKPGQPTDTGDVLFGTQTVGFGVDRDVIRVGAEVGKFDRIRMRVLDNDIFIRSMKVVFANGESEEIAYNADVKSNTRTRWIDLKGDRFIKEIQLIYNSKPNFKGRAYIEVFGQYAEGWLGPQGEGKKFNEGWVLLGGQTAGFTIDRNDIIKVGRNDGGFRKIRVNVKDETITLFEVRVIYGNGEVDIIPANRTAVRAGGTYGPIDLKGGSRIIQEIRPTYRTRIFQQGGVARGRAVVEFWGQH
jgi:hypothetical protein